MNYSDFSTYSYINITLCARIVPKNRELCMLNLMVCSELQCFFNLFLHYITLCARSAPKNRELCMFSIILMLNLMVF